MHLKWIGTHNPPGFWIGDGTYHQLDALRRLEGDVVADIAKDLLATGEFVEDHGPRPKESFRAQAHAVVQTAAGTLRDCARVVFGAICSPDISWREEASRICAEARAEYDIAPPSPAAPPPPPKEVEEEEDDEISLVPPEEQQTSVADPAEIPRLVSSGSDDPEETPPSEQEDLSQEAKLAWAFELLQEKVTDLRSMAADREIPLSIRLSKAQIIARLLDLPEGWDRQ